MSGPLAGGNDAPTFPGTGDCWYAGATAGGCPVISATACCTWGGTGVFQFESMYCRIAAATWGFCLSHWFARACNCAFWRDSPAAPRGSGRDGHWIGDKGRTISTS
jgi:hypothetical protein